MVAAADLSEPKKDFETLESKIELTEQKRTGDYELESLPVEGFKKWESQTDVAF